MRAVDGSLQEKFQMLKAIGIPYWRERDTERTALISENPIFCAPCLVILSKPIPRQEETTYKILIGMLKVLELPEDQLCLATLSSNLSLPTQYPELLVEIQKWAPSTILFLGEVFGTEGTGDRPDLCFIDSAFFTYHPTELQKNPELKRKAFNTLLLLKNFLSQNTLNLAQAENILTR